VVSGRILDLIGTFGRSKLKIPSTFQNNRRKKEGGQIGYTVVIKWVTVMGALNLNSMKI